MKAGDVFSLDTQSIEEVAKFTKTPLVDVQKKLKDGDTYSVAKGYSTEVGVVRASRWEDGKPKKGRPRRFPTSTVLRLLGEESETDEDVVVADEAAEDTALEERGEALLASDSQGDADSW